MPRRSANNNGNRSKGITLVCKGNKRTEKVTLNRTTAKKKKKRKHLLIKLITFSL